MRPSTERVPRLEELLLERVPRTTAKQGLTGTRLQRQLTAEGYAVGTTVIRQYLRERRRQRQEVYIPLIHRPGDEAQVDLFEMVVDVDGQWVKAWEFLPRLMYSGREFAWLYERCGKLRERAIAPKCSLSAALTVTTVLGLPIGQYPTTSVSEIK
jgi:transposase